VGPVWTPTPTMQIKKKSGTSTAYARTMCIPLNTVFRDEAVVPKIAVFNFFHAFSILDFKNYISSIRRGRNTKILV
jgi:hypothetical protein